MWASAFSQATRIRSKSSAVARSAATAAASLSTPILNSVMLSKSRECSSMVGSMEFK